LVRGNKKKKKNKQQRGSGARLPLQKPIDGHLEKKGHEESGGGQSWPDHWRQKKSSGPTASPGAKSNQVPRANVKGKGRKSVKERSKEVPEWHPKSSNEWGTRECQRKKGRSKGEKRGKKRPGSNKTTEKQGLSKGRSAQQKPRSYPSKSIRKPEKPRAAVGTEESPVPGPGNVKKGTWSSK